MVVLYVVVTFTRTDGNVCERVEFVLQHVEHLDNFFWFNLAQLDTTPTATCKR
jgi:hypothetical protein